MSDESLEERARAQFVEVGRRLSEIHQRRLDIVVLLQDLQAEYIALGDEQGPLGQRYGFLADLLDETLVEPSETDEPAG